MRPALIGVDPGHTGAIAACSPAGTLLWVADMPNPLTFGTLDLLLHDNGPVTIIKVAIEAQHAMPKNGSKSNFLMGEAFGSLRMFFAALKVPVDTPSPQRWKKDVGLTADKARSIRKAHEFFPRQTHEFHGPRGGDKDGRAEAALLAYWLAETERRGRWAA